MFVAVLEQSLGHANPLDIVGDAAFRFVAGAVGAFQRAFAGREELLTVDRADAGAAVVGAGLRVDDALADHDEFPHCRNGVLS